VRAAVYDRFGGPEVLAVREVPDLVPAAGEILVRVRAAALNPKDVLVRKGKFQPLAGRGFPRGIGFDWAGEVVSADGAGPGGDGYRPGDRLFGMIDGWRGRSCAELVAVSPGQCARMPAALPFEEAAALPLVAQTALQALRDLGGVGPGDTVCVNGGSGGVGTHAIQVARALGAQVVSVSSARNLALCRELGAAEALDYARDDPFAVPARYRVVFDTVGSVTYARARRALDRRGTFVAAVPSLRILLDALRTALGRPRARLVVVRSRAVDLVAIAQLVETGRLRAVVDRVFALEEIGAACAHVETRRARGKVVLRIA